MTFATVIARIVDYQDFLEIQADFAPNIVIGFGRLQGRPVGIIANQPNALAGALDIDASDKAARFVRFCNAFNIPLLTLVDVPGFLPGVEQEYRRHHSPRREAAVRLLVGHRAEADVDPAQGLWGRLCGDVRQRPRRRPRGRLADRRDRRDGSGGRRRDCLPPRNRCRREQGRTPQGADRAVSRDFCESLCRRRRAASSTTSSSRPRRAGTWRMRWKRCIPSGNFDRRRNTD